MMNPFPRPIRMVAFCLLAAGSAADLCTAQTSYPMVMSLEPVAAQIGQTSEHVVKSRYTMQDAYQVLVSGTGVTGDVVLPDQKDETNSKPLQTLTVRFHVDPNAMPGVRDFRIAAPTGVSTVGQLVIVHDKVVREHDNNDEPASAQSVELPAAICGRIEKAEDVDFFKFHVDGGTTLSFHVRCMRLQDRIHDLQQHADPIIAIRNASGSTVAASDNSFSGDPLLSHTFDQAGDYFLEIRDVRYQGNQYWGYCVEVNDRPFAATLFPLAVNADDATPLKPIGPQIPENTHARVLIEHPVRSGLQRMPVQLGTRTQSLPVVISNLPPATEAEGANDAVDEAQAITVPCGINGVIESEGDIDCYLFDAKQGQRYSFEVFARRAHSGLDPHLRLLGEKGNQLQINDDLRLGRRSYADSKIENWTAPADGKYVIEIRDLHLRGGSRFVYHIAITESEPSFTLYADTDKTPLTPGTGGVIFVRVERKNGFDGEVQLHIDGLPPGVTASCGRILAGQGQDGCIVLKASPDAQPCVANVVIRGTASIPESDGRVTTLESEAVIYQETYQPGGGRGHWPVETHTVSVGQPSDIRRVTLSTHTLTLKPGESKTIDVEIERGEGFDKNVTLAVTNAHLNTVYGNSLPPGVTLDQSRSKTALTGGATKGSITLTAADNAAQVVDQQIVVMANVSLNFVMKATYASDPVAVTVE